MVEERERTTHFAFLGCIGGGLAVLLGAFGAHGLKSSLSAEMLGIFETAVRYQMYHSLALIAVTLLSAQSPRRISLFRTAGWLFVAGIIVFSGSLFVLTLTPQTWLGAVTPIGGLSFIAGWSVLGWALVPRRKGA